MEILTLEQGTQEWLDARKDKLCSSDASAMLGYSKYKKRIDFIHEFVTGEKEDMSGKEFIFAKGHAAEASQRPFIEAMIDEELFPCVVTEQVEGLELLASYDGLTMLYDISWEHKLHNADLIAFIEENNDLPDTHWPQCEQQLLVSGAEKVIFTVSDGTEERRFNFEYFSNADRAFELIEGWKKFVSDCENYKPEEKLIAPEAATVIANQASSFPAVTFSMNDKQLTTNIGEILPLIKKRAEDEMSKVLKTDQDFADKDSTNKAVKEARANLKKMAGDVQAEFVDVKSFIDTASQIDEILKKMQSQGEKQVKEEKAKRKVQIVARAQTALDTHYQQCCEGLRGYQIPPVNYDFQAVLKNKKTIQSMIDSLNDELTRAKGEFTRSSDHMINSLQVLDEEAKDFEFLFGDFAQLITTDHEPLRQMIIDRIKAHKADQKAKEEAKEEAKKQIAIIRDCATPGELPSPEQNVEFLTKEIEDIRLLILDPKVFGDLMNEAMEARSFAVNELQKSLDSFQSMIDEAIQAKEEASKEKAENLEVESKAEEELSKPARKVTAKKAVKADTQVEPKAIVQSEATEEVIDTQGMIEENVNALSRIEVIVDSKEFSKTCLKELSGDREFKAGEYRVIIERIHH